jgi:sarcosine oxidase subunit delta
VGLRLPCRNCGLRAYSEFTFGGELRDWSPHDGEEDFRLAFMRDNLAGDQSERWFHAYGCRHWTTLRRDTLTNRVNVLP